jgi:hypothetical protein
MSKSVNLNGTFTYEYIGNDIDVLDILDHLRTSSIIYTKEDFNRVRNLALCHGWEIITEQTKETKEK